MGCLVNMGNSRSRHTVNEIEEAPRLFEEAVHSENVGATLGPTRPPQPTTELTPATTSGPPPNNPNPSIVPHHPPPPSMVAPRISYPAPHHPLPVPHQPLPLYMQPSQQVHYLSAIVQHLQQNSFIPDFGLRVTCPHCRGVISPPILSTHPFPKLALQQFQCPCQAVLAMPDSSVVQLISRLKSGAFPGLHREMQYAMSHYLEEERNDTTQRHLIVLPTRDWCAPTGESPEEHKTCGVCMEPYNAGDNLRTLPCLHFFHTSCCDPWLLVTPFTG